MFLMCHPYSMEVAIASGTVSLPTVSLPTLMPCPFAKRRHRRWWLLWAGSHSSSSRLLRIVTLAGFLFTACQLAHQVQARFGVRAESVGGGLEEQACRLETMDSGLMRHSMDRGFM